MAFSKSITDNAGVASTYWVITSAHADFATSTVMCSVAGWLDATAYTNKLKASARRPFYFSVPFSALPTVAASNNISMEELYAAVLAIINNPAKSATTPLFGATLVA